jgi:hypothetical protein
MSERFSKMKADISELLPHCPLCQEKSIETQSEHDYWSEDYMACSSCRAKWHIYYSEKLEWATLIQPGTNELGKQHLGIRHVSTFWANLKEKRPPDWKPREIERQEEPTVRIKRIEINIQFRCRYCGKFYDAALDRCPHCSGRS